MADYLGEASPAPEWFTNAIATPYAVRKVSVDGVSICYQQWGDPDKPGLLLVHGNGAHGHWFDFIAPAFSDDYNVVAITLSGMGDSEWREAYDFQTYSDELIGVMRDAGMFDHETKPIIAAHSLGGILSLAAADRYGHHFKGLALMDTSIHAPEVRISRPTARPKDQPVFYADKNSAIARFRLQPPQKCENHFILDHIARHSLRQVDRDGETGWIWKFDPSFWLTMDWDDAELWAMLKTTSCKIAFMRGERSVLFTDKVRDDILSHVDLPMFPVKDAGHHMFLDKPLETIATLRDIFSLWNE